MRDADSTTLPFWDRYRRLFNRRGSDWWSIVFGYPIARLLVVPILPVAAFTASRLTLLGFGVKLAAAAVLAAPGGSPLVAALLLQLAQILDSMDGTLARARGSFSHTGAFLDKVTDAVGLLAIATALGWRATAESGEPLPLALGATGGAAFVVVCYMYWLVQAIREPAPSPVAMAGGAPVPGWGDIGREWLRGWLRAVRFSEADLYFWMGLGALLGRWTEVVCLVFATQTITMTKRAYDHYQTLRHLERG